MIPVLIVVISFIIGLRFERTRALALAGAVAAVGVATVVILTLVDDTAFLSSASGYIKMAAGVVACLAAALVGGVIRERRGTAVA